MNGHIMRAPGVGAVISLSLAAALTLVVSAPAAAEEKDQDCVLYVDDDVLVCVPTGDDLDAAFFAETGLVRVPSGSDDGSGVAGRGPQVVHDLVTYYADNSYAGSSLTLTRSSSCNGSTLTNVPSLALYGIDNAISSFQTYGTCTTRLYADASYGGATYGYAGSTSSLPSFNDVASSTKTH